MSAKRKLKGSLLSVIGFLLSPLSWWNDLFVNVPLALALAWLVSWFWPRAFAVSFVTAYWLTNVAGLVLLQKGAREFLGDAANPCSRKEWWKDLAVSLLYTLVIVVLVKLGLLQPLPDYFRDR
jgi:hypothetical protein